MPRTNHSRVRGRQAEEFRLSIIVNAVRSGRQPREEPDGTRWCEVCNAGSQATVVPAAHGPGWHARLCAQCTRRLRRALQ